MERNIVTPLFVELYSIFRKPTLCEEDINV